MMWWMWWIIKINGGMLVKIYDRNEGLDQQLNYCMVLGVHNFSHFLSQLVNKRTSSIFLQGTPRQITQNILWNEYFCYTLLKDIYRTVFAEVQHRNCFIKIADKTYRLSDCLEYGQARKIEQDLLRYPCFTIEGFMRDSSVKVVEIDVGGVVGVKNYDIIFDYVVGGTQEVSFSSSKICESVGYSDITRTRTKNKSQSSKNKIAVSSLFKTQQKRYDREMEQSNLEKSAQQQQRQERPRTNSSIKYCSQRKQMQTQVPPGRISFQTKPETNKKNLNSNSCEQLKQVNTNCLKQSTTTAKPSTGYKTQILNKEDLTAAILNKKEDKIKQYRQMLETKEQQFQDRFTKANRDHEEEVSAIKKEVTDVLANYKAKNKKLRKQNQCLISQNRSLLASNSRLEQTLTRLTQDMQSLQKNQEQLQKSNEEYKVKLQGIEESNARMLQKMKENENAHKKDVAEREKILQDYKAKYDRVMGTIRYATLVDKENQGGTQ